MQFASVQPLDRQQHESAILTITPAMAISAGVLQPAPVPNPDIDPPRNGALAGPQLSPALLSSSIEFQGNGFAHASSADYGLDQRRQPAAGLNLKLPVAQP